MRFLFFFIFLHNNNNVIKNKNLNNNNNNNNNVYLLQRPQVEVYEENHSYHLFEAHNYHTI